MSMVFFVVFILNVLSVQSAEWDYRSQDKWPGECNHGRIQSPINIEMEKATPKTWKKFTLSNYEDLKDPSFDNNGHTIQASFKQTKNSARISGGDLPGTYSLAQYHFHWGSNDNQGSEHTLNKKKFPLEVHFVHSKTEYGTTLSEAIEKGKGASDTLAVFAFMIEVDNEKKGKKNDSVKEIFPVIELSSLEGRNSEFYRYQGSLTTPPCNEIIIWTVFKEPLKIASHYLKSFRKMEDGNGTAIQDNFRKMQPLNERKIYKYTPKGSGEPLRVFWMITLIPILGVTLNFGSLWAQT